jgi:hypothetical protein
MSARTRSAALRHIALAVAGATLLTLTLLGCGGSGNSAVVPLPPGGVAIGNLVCSNDLAQQTVVAHGQQLVIEFTLVDVNTAVPGRLLPVSFDVVGGTLLTPPTMTDGAGHVVVTFIATDFGFVGAARVRLIQPGARLECDASFLIQQPACILRARVLTLADTVVVPEDACGGPAIVIERHLPHKVRYRITRPNPVTLVEEPVPGALIHVVATGLLFLDQNIGPTNASGEVTLTAVPAPTGVGPITIFAEVVHVDLDGPQGVPDGVNDELPCNTCTIRFTVINPICDADGLAVIPANIDYFTSTGVPRSAPLRPGDYAEVTAFYILDGTPQAFRPVLVDAADGFVNGSEFPVVLLTGADGHVTVTYTARDGFEGVDTVTFRDNAGTLQCTQTASVTVVTCDFTFDFTPAPSAGNQSNLVIEFDSVDPSTLFGETVSLDVQGGFFTMQPPNYVVQNVGGVPTVMATLNVTPGFSGPDVLSASFVSGYPCVTVSKPFTVSP